MTHLVLTAAMWFAMAELVNSLKARNSKNDRRLRTESVKMLIRAKTGRFETSDYKLWKWMEPTSAEASGVPWKPRWQLWWRYLKLNGPIQLHYTNREVEPDRV